ncbi:helix-turn-helix domain-containing protein [Actinomadura pelletieri]|uniref:helix-turn-helix domain-containing protein n=1 Tax=Actinomadura pelletieri TaxID=111805 RepID=UPI000EAF5129|nr:helix-turn-helix transcriptional regulator [Actinomadura pelletieri]
MPDAIGVRVARARKRRGLTRHGLAQRARYSRSHIAQVEAGARVVPRPSSLPRPLLGLDV